MIIVKIHAGLGNQLFQYAFGYNVSLITKQELYLDLSFYKLKPEYEGIYELDLFQTKYKIADDKLIQSITSYRKRNKYLKLLDRILKRDFIYENSKYLKQQAGKYPQLRKLKNIQDVYLHGYWASENYFIDNFKQVREQLNLKNELIAKIDQNIINDIKHNNCVSVHIRRGDYLTNNFFHNLELDYYHRAIRYLKSIVNNPFFVFFSDDINWVKEYFKNENSIFVENQKDYEDLYLMSLCKHNIIANSTFSWWGAYLNKKVDKIVIAPKIWYSNKKAQKKYETKSKLIPETWLKM